jgi:hypothetical protein
MGKCVENQSRARIHAWSTARRCESLCMGGKAMLCNQHVSVGPPSAVRGAAEDAVRRFTGGDEGEEAGGCW